MDSDTLTVEWVATSELHPNPANPRLNDAAVGPVADSLRRFGWQQPIVAKRTGEIVAGHTRLLAAKQLGMERVPVFRFEGSDLDAVAYGIADNRTARKPIVRGALLEIMGRDSVFDAVVEDNGQPLIGMEVLEALDLWPDPQRGVLTTNPDSPDIPLYNLLGVR